MASKLQIGGAILALLILVGAVTYALHQQKTIYELKQKLSNAEARLLVDTLFIEKPIIEKDTLVVIRPEVIKDTLIIESEKSDTIYIERIKTVAGDTIFVWGLNRVRVFAKANCINGQMMISAGHYFQEKKEKSWNAGLGIGGGAFLQSAAFGLNVDFTYRHYGLWLMGLTDGKTLGFMTGLKLEF